MGCLRAILYDRTHGSEGAVTGAFRRGATFVFRVRHDHRDAIQSMQKIVTNLWFDGRVEEALELYTSCFEDARVTNITRYTEEGMGKTGDIMTAEFELAGQEFCIINGGPMYTARRCRSWSTVSIRRGGRACGNA